MKMSPEEIVERSRKLSQQLTAVMEAAAREDWEAVRCIGQQIEADFGEVKQILQSSVH